MKVMTRNTPKWRVDGQHREPPNPHLYDLPEPQTIRLLIDRLNHPDADLNKIGRRMAQFSGLARYVVAYGNFLLASDEHRLREPVHATVFLGTRRLNELLQNLTAPEPPAKAG